MCGIIFGRTVWDQTTSFVRLFVFFRLCSIVNNEVFLHNSFPLSLRTDWCYLCTECCKMNTAKWNLLNDCKFADCYWNHQLVLMLLYAILLYFLSCGWVRKTSGFNMYRSSASQNGAFAKRPWCWRLPWERLHSGHQEHGDEGSVWFSLQSLVWISNFNTMIISMFGLESKSCNQFWSLDRAKQSLRHGCLFCLGLKNTSGPHLQTWQVPVLGEVIPVQMYRRQQAGDQPVAGTDSKHWEV